MPNYVQPAAKQYLVLLFTVQLLQLSTTADAASYPITSAGVQLGSLLTNLQTAAAPQVQLPIYNGSLAAAITHRLGVYLLRPPIRPPVTGLETKQAVWLASSASKAFGWKRLPGSQAAAGRAAQKLANTGAIVLAVADAKCLGGASAAVAVVAPDAPAQNADIIAEGPRVVVGVNRGRAQRLLYTCFNKQGVRYYTVARAASQQLAANFSSIWWNWRFPDAEYLFEAGPGGAVQGVVIFYGSKGLTYYDYIDYGVKTNSWAYTAWFGVRWRPNRPVPKAVPPFQPHFLNFDIFANFTLFNANNSLHYYKHGYNLSIMKRLPDTGPCSHCGFWYANDPKLAFAFYISSYTPTLLRGRLMAVAGSPLLTAQPLINHMQPANLTYNGGFGMPVPYWYEGKSSGTPGAAFAGQLQWRPKWGNYTSRKGKTVVKIAGAVLRLNHQGKVTSFFKGTSYKRGSLPRL